MARVGKSIRISGLVQGVFFRAWTAEQARSLGVAGWVRNCADGSVEAHVEGEESAVAILVEALHRGPPAAVVDNVRVVNVMPEETGSFVIQH